MTPRTHRTTIPNSFSDAVKAYNEQYGTNYTDEEAKEALGN